MPTTNSSPLPQAARTIGAAPSVLRRALNRFSLNEKQNGQRVIPAEVVRLFARTRWHAHATTSAAARNLILEQAARGFAVQVIKGRSVVGAPFNHSPEATS